jgi:hypothetical protein
MSSSSESRVKFDVAATGGGGNEEDAFGDNDVRMQERITFILRVFSKFSFWLSLPWITTKCWVEFGSYSSVSRFV